MTKKPKPPYPWRSLATAIGAISFALLITVVVAIGYGALSRAGLTAIILLSVFGVIGSSIRAYSRATRKLFEHRHTVRAVKEEWAQQMEGTAPLLRPAQENTENLLQPAASVEPDETILLRPHQQ
jgi:hypothetical protein